MPDNLYEVVALGARYWFVFLGVLIVLRSFRLLRRDRREKHRRIRELPDAGMIGELTVLRGSEELPEGSVIPVPWEGTLGSIRSMDIYLPVPGVFHRHAEVCFEKGKGLAVIPRFRHPVEVDGVQLTHRMYAENHRMGHGSVLVIGEAVLKLRVFMTLGVTHAARFEDDLPAAEPPTDAVPMEEAWPDEPQPECPQTDNQPLRPHRRRIRREDDDE